MNQSLVRWGSVAVVALALAGCGGGGGSGGTPGGTTPPPASLKDAIALAAAQPSNDSATNSSAPFTVLQGNGLPVVSIGADGQPVVKFTVFDNGKVVSGLTIKNVTLAIAKVVPGSGGNPDQWINYVTNVNAASASSKGPHGEPAVLASANRASTDPKPCADAACSNNTQLSFDAANGYYTYKFTAKITDPAWSAVVQTSATRSGTYETNGVAFEPNRQHRVAIQLNYVNAQGQTVKVNPYFDFTFDSNDNSVPAATPIRQVVDVKTCNNCHNKLAAHGGNRVDTQFCVMCHNPGTTDVVSGNKLTMSTFIHSIHAGKRLMAGGLDYYIGDTDFADVGFPQDLRNCTTCHSGSAVQVGSKAVTPTAQGDNWKNHPSREACLSCHQSDSASAWYQNHAKISSVTGKDPTQLVDSDCAGCHVQGTALGADRVHFNQQQADAAKYKVNVQSASYDASTRLVTVKYNVTDPTNGNAAYNLTADCTGSGSTATCANTTRFGNLRFLVAYQTLVGQPGPTDWTSYNNGGNGASAYLYKGTNDGGNNYTVTIAIPPDTATSVAAGTARVISYGQVKEQPLAAMAAVDPRPVTSTATADLLNVGVQNTYYDFAISGTVQPRREIVSTDNCNVCHGMLGTASASNTLANAFHGGARNTVEACSVCHDPNRASTSNIMTDGSAYYESFQFKRFIHGIHGNSVRTYPFTHGNKVQGAFNMDGTPIAPWTTPMTSTAENYAAEVKWPDGTGINCNACHVNDSYKADRSVVATVISKPAGVTDPLQWLVMSPKTATCTSCHDGTNPTVGTVIGHVTQWGGAGYGNLTQAQSWNTVERCDDCHASGAGFVGVDVVHGLK